MATWDELVSYVRVRYEIMRQREGELWFDLLTTGERHQRVAVRQVTGEDGHPWAQITSAVGYLEKIDLARCLVLAGEAVTGGVVAEDNLVLFRHSIPLGDTEIDGFERPFRLVVDDRRPHGGAAHRHRRPAGANRTGGLQRLVDEHPQPRQELFGFAPGQRARSGHRSAARRPPCARTGPTTPHGLS